MCECSQLEWNEISISIRSLVSPKSISSIEKSPPALVIIILLPSNRLKMLTIEANQLITWRKQEKQTFFSILCREELGKKNHVLRWDSSSDSMLARFARGPRYDSRRRPHDFTTWVHLGVNICFLDKFNWEKNKLLICVAILHLHPRSQRHWH